MRRGKVKAPRPGHDMSWLSTQRVLAIRFRGPCCPRITSSIRRFLQGATSGPKRPFAPRERRRDDESGPGAAKLVFAKTTHLRQMASAVDVSDSGM